MSSLLPCSLFSLTLIWEYRPLCQERERLGKQRTDLGISICKFQIPRKFLPFPSFLTSKQRSL